LPPIVSFSFKEKQKKERELIAARQNKQRTDLILPSLPMFVRLQHERVPTVLLKTQYRCHPTIAEMSNAMFYENLLLHGVSQEMRECLIDTLGPVTFIDASEGFEKRASFSYKNDYEAAFIVVFLKYLCDKIYEKL